ncbi:hypothetical protein BCV70DRAFT_70924 [Testicularia cyperi]|uniref:Secreted protein n=1 Tax=Testicularia cyperi TaxID=1882483 RepID=A0A317XFP8_9BASI|nr:hypothetical protein BCV70DRAFT_70924 [Testicularia cyperi]
MARHAFRRFGHRHLGTLALLGLFARTQLSNSWLSTCLPACLTRGQLTHSTSPVCSALLPRPVSALCGLILHHRSHQPWWSSSPPVSYNQAFPSPSTTSSSPCPLHPPSPPDGPRFAHAIILVLL